ncbi:MAG: glutamine-hydrolyzing carbamoyl-phosphate synthase small subunit [Bacteriovoracia bacterium]
MKSNEGVLVIELPNGETRSFPGTLFGASVFATAPNRTDRGYGEVVFNTSMTGYQEILTDPSYYGQMVCMTYPHIGNTGINREDAESGKPWCAGFIVHEMCDTASNWRAEGELNDYLIKHQIPGLQGVDTRALTLVLRKLGVTRGVILPKADESRAKTLLKELPAFEGRDMIREVSTTKPYAWPTPEAGEAAPAGATAAKSPAKYKVVAMDFGVKWNLLRSLEARGCQVQVVPATTAAESILAYKPDGVFLSNGPGDPSAAPYAVKAIQGLIGQVPIFGVCMGHQLLSLAIGAKTYKLKFGHRGGNQPVQDHTTGKVEISSHNHGYAVDAATVPASAEITHLNLNDKTVEGLRLKNAPAFSVQYHPEACPGPHDSEGLFDRFIDLMGEFRR